MIPKIISHYEILKKLGSGGMGEVFQAQDQQQQRIVALKILNREIAADPKNARRFLMEGRTATTLSHPNIAEVYEFGESDGLFFISMEYLEGQTLEDVIAKRKMSVHEILEIAIQVADTLASAHGRGIIHRDIKPSNIMLMPNGGVKVLDFGLARFEETVSGRLNEITTRVKTESGTLLGTVHYMSPEQALGQIVDARSDLFSLGILLYRMTASRLPFSGPSAVATIDQILHSTPAPVRDWNASAPEELELIISKCLRKDPSERYQSANDLLADLKSMRRQLDSSDSAPLHDARSKMPFFLRRPTARFLFTLLQIMYLSMYLSALYWSDGLYSGLMNMLPRRMGEFLFNAFAFTALPMVAARLYFISMNALDHEQTAVHFRKIFPFLWVMDVLWALSPFGLSMRWSPILSLACIPPLVFSPFSQRTLLSAAYNSVSGRRRK